MIVILNLVSLFTWSYSFIRPIRIKYVTTRLKLILIRHLRKSTTNTDNTTQEQQIATTTTTTVSDDSLLYRDDSHVDFARNYLKCDGIFVLRLLETNTSDFVVTHVIEELFYSYERKASQPVVLDGLAKMMSTLGPDQGLLSLGKLLFLPVMSDPKMAATFNSGGITVAPPPATTTITNSNNSKMLLPSLTETRIAGSSSSSSSSSSSTTTTTTNDPLQNAPRLLVPPTPTRRRTTTNEKSSSVNSTVDQTNVLRQTSSLPTFEGHPKPTVDEVTEILRERRRKIKCKKR